MYTNYYAITNHCDKCGRKDSLHLGKSSWGWDFTFHLVPEHYTNFKEFKKFLDSVTIIDEYDAPITKEELLSIIEKKSIEYPFAHKKQGYWQYIGKYYFVTWDFF